MNPEEVQEMVNQSIARPLDIQQKTAMIIEETLKSVFRLFSNIIKR